MTRFWIIAGLAVCGSAGAAAPSFYFDTVAVGTYRVARCEVTQAQYQEITGENPSLFPDPTAPVDSVSWDDAEAFCRLLTQRERDVGRLPADWRYELPTDAQWDQFSAGTDLAGAVTSLDHPRESTATVGGGRPNPLGLFDVTGNVWEWCRDWYNNDIRRRDANPDMPYLPTNEEAAAHGPEELFKVLRGGAWDTCAADDFKLGSRLRYAPGMANRHTGFRCVVEPVSGPPSPRSP